MTENDYIAEYVKEKHGGILGLDFALWKFSKKITEVGKLLVDAFKDVDLSELDKGDTE